MAVKVRFYRFNKRPNSTSNPHTNKDSAEIWQTRYECECVLLEPCSILTPVLRIDIKHVDDEGFRYRENINLYNYAEIAEWQRLYFITDIVYNYGLVDIYLKVDVMATYQNDIFKEKTLLARCEKFRDPTLQDAEYPATIHINQSIEEFVDRKGYAVLTSNVLEGSYIIGVINPSSTATAVTYYLMTGSEFSTLKEYLFNPNTYSSNPAEWLMEISKDLMQVLYNPFQYISTLMYLPIKNAYLAPNTVPVTNIKFGWWNIELPSGVSGRRITSGTAYKLYIGSVTIYPHPQCGNVGTDNPKYLNCKQGPFDGRGTYLNYYPYSEFTLVLEPYGTIVLDSDTIGRLLTNKYPSHLNLDFYISIDYATGSGYLMIEPELEDWEEKPQFPNIKTQIGVQLQIGQITQNLGGAVTTLISNKVNVDAWNSTKYAGAQGRATSGLITGIYDALNDIFPKMQTSGSNGDMSCYFLKRYVKANYKIMTEIVPSETGYPLLQEIELRDCREGYVKTVFTDLVISGTDSERNEIIETLSNGAYMED